MTEFALFVLAMLFAQVVAVTMVIAACYIILCKTKTAEIKSKENKWIEEREP